MFDLIWYHVNKTKSIKIENKNIKGRQHLYNDGPLNIFWLHKELSKCTKSIILKFPLPHVPCYGKCHCNFKNEILFFLFISEDMVDRQLIHKCCVNLENCFLVNPFNTLVIFFVVKCYLFVIKHSMSTYTAIHTCS